MIGKTEHEKDLARQQAEQRARTAYTSRLRAYADMLDKHPEISLPDHDMPMPETGPFVTASYLGQIEALAEFLDRTGVPVHRYGTVSINWYADSTDEVDRIATQAGITPEWKGKDKNRYEAVQRFGPNFEYEVSYRKAVPAQVPAPSVPAEAVPAETGAAA